MSKENNHQIGRIGEDIAVRYLLKNKYDIIIRNFYTYSGEIDIIAKQDKEIVFVEVKTRSSDEYGRPLEAVTPLKQKHMYKSAKYYLYKTRQENAFVRFDVIEIYIVDGKVKINHIKQII